MEGQVNNVGQGFSRIFKFSTLVIIGSFLLTGTALSAISEAPQRTITHETNADVSSITITDNTGNSDPSKMVL